MNALPAWFTDEYRICTIDTLPAYHAKRWQHADDDLKAYTLDALKHGAYLVYNHPDANSISVAMPHIEPDGSEIVFTQNLYGNPKNNTFIKQQGAHNHTYDINRCRECEGIPIWDTDALYYASCVCDRCKKRVSTLSELKRYPFTGKGCSECAKIAAEQFERHQMWR